MTDRLIPKNSATFRPSVKRLRIDTMRRHVEQLLSGLPGTPDNEIALCWIDDPNDAQVLRDLDNSVLEVHLPVIRSALDYATALHEIGHIRGRYQNSNKLLTRERWAWQWARDNALSWTPAMEADARASEAWYVKRIQNGELSRFAGASEVMAHNTEKEEP